MLQTDNYTDMSVYVDECSSRHQTAWVCMLYAYKTCVLAAGLYFTWQTRHVTLPSLKDTRRQYIVIYNVIAMATLALPVLLSRCIVGGGTRYVVGALVIWFTLMITVTLLFLPKVRGLGRGIETTPDNSTVVRLKRTVSPPGGNHQTTTFRLNKIFHHIIII